MKYEAPLLKSFFPRDGASYAHYHKDFLALPRILWYRKGLDGVKHTLPTILEWSFQGRKPATQSNDVGSRLMFRFRGNLNLRWSRVLLGVYGLLLFSLHVQLAWQLAREHHRWAMGDWLINYQGGFVRRGLLGEIIYRVALKTAIDPVYWVLAIQILAVGIYFGFALKVLAHQPDLRPYVFLIFSPYIFGFALFDPQGAFRKEILFFALLATFVWLALFHPSRLPMATWVLVVLYPFLILTHEMLILFLPYLLIPGLWVHGNFFKRHPKRWGLLFVWNGFALGFVLMGRGTPMQVEAIIDSLQAFYPWKPVGAIAYLSEPPKCHLCERLSFQDLKLMARLWLLLLFAFLPLWEKGFRFWQRPLVRWSLVLPFASSTLLFLIARDWGRFVYIHAVSWFLLSLLDTEPLSPSSIPLRVFQHKKGLLLVALLVVGYANFWYLHHVRGFQLVLPPDDNLHRLITYGKELWMVLVKIRY